MNTLFYYYIFYHRISSEQTYLVFCTFFRVCPNIFEWKHAWSKRTIFKKQKFSLRVLDFACFFSYFRLVLIIKKRVSIEVLKGFVNSRSSHRSCSIKIGVIKKFDKFSLFFNKVAEHLRTTASVHFNAHYKPFHFLLQPWILMVAWTLSLKVT